MILQEKILLKELQPNHWASVARIYRQGIDDGHATFESEVPTWDEWNRDHLPYCRWVAELDEDIAAWGALSPVSNRCVYGGVAEVSVYVANHFKGMGIGSMLLKKLVESSEQKGIWTLKAGIFPENKASIHIHKKCGFRSLGLQEKIGKMKDGQWRDVLLMERRSKKVGIQ